MRGERERDARPAVGRKPAVSSGNYGSAPWCAPQLGVSPLVAPATRGQPRLRPRLGVTPLVAPGAPATRGQPQVAPATRGQPPVAPATRGQPPSCASSGQSPVAPATGAARSRDRCCYARLPGSAKIAASCVGTAPRSVASAARSMISAGFVPTISRCPLHRNSLALAQMRARIGFALT